MEKRALGTHRTPLPLQITRIREESSSIYVSNLPQEKTKNELEAMFCRAGRTVDVFIPVDKRNNKKRGFSFVRFQTFREAEKAVELAEERSWGGRKI